MGSRIVKSAVGAALVAGVMAAFPAAAQDKVAYPVDTVTLITHSSPGGGTDVYLREMINHLSKYIDASFVVDNVRGGSGAAAMAHIANGPADGSVLYGTTPTFINTSLISNPDYTYEDMMGVVNIFLDPQIVYVRAESPYETLAEIVEAAQEEPGSIRFGVTTPGSLDRQVMEQFKAITGAEGPVITHDGGGDLLISVLNGTVDLGIGEVQELRSQLEAGQVRLIATYTVDRLDDFPDVQTAQEQGIDLVVNKFRGLAGHPDLPQEVLSAWDEAIPQVLEDEEFRQWYRDSALVPNFIPSSEYDQFLKQFAEEQRAFLVEYNIIEE